MDSPIRTEKQVAPLRQYHRAYASGQAYVWNVMFGLVVGPKGLGLGALRDEQASVVGYQRCQCTKVTKTDRRRLEGI